MTNFRKLLNKKLEDPKAKHFYDLAIARKKRGDVSSKRRIIKTHNDAYVML